MATFQVSVILKVAQLVLWPVGGHLCLRSNDCVMDIWTLRWDREVDVVADGACKGPGARRKASAPASWTGDWPARNTGEEEAVV